MTLVPVLVIAAILAAVGILGFGARNGISKEQVKQEVTTLLAGIPQHGAILGSPRAPITVQVFADLECPTVQSFVISHLPSIVRTWVRDGSVRLEYRSLKTDTIDEHTFFRQEVAALAAGRQDKMWNFVLTFVHEQEPRFTGYATESFLTGIADQVPGMTLPQWRHDREDALLSARVARGVYTAHTKGLGSTPSLLIRLTDDKAAHHALPHDIASITAEVNTSLAHEIASLNREAAADNPTIYVKDLSERKELRELIEE